MLRFALFGCLTLSAASCATRQYEVLPTEIVAHRGASYDAPENSLSAFELAWTQGADAIEGDFYLTADGHIVCHHDTTTKRTAGVDLPVTGQTLAELKRHDVGSWKHRSWTGERIPTLQEVLATVPDGGKILIEIKRGPDIVPALVRVLRAMDLDVDQVAVIAFDEHVIAAFEAEMPLIRTYWLSDFTVDPGGRSHPTAAEIVATATRIGADGVDLEADTGVLDKDFVATLRAGGLEFHVWTVNEPRLAVRMISLGVDSITTDRPGWLRERLTAE